MRCRSVFRLSINNTNNDCTLQQLTTPPLVVAAAADDDDVDTLPLATQDAHVMSNSHSSVSATMTGLVFLLIYSYMYGAQGR